MPLQEDRLSLAYFAMRFGILCLVTLLGAGVASSQTPKAGSPSPSPRPALPEFRPALIGSAPNSLINTIDAADLIKKGQKEAAVMFSCLVAPTGEIVRSGAYRGTRGSELLEQELLKRLATAKFIPAIHNHQPVIAVFYGTLKFAVVNGKPRLRIFANQQLEELDEETDYIDPQPYVGQDSKFSGLHYPETGSTVALTGGVELALKIDARGNLTDMQVLSEEPPLLGFGDAALSDFSGAKFIPAFRSGQPVECNVKIPIYYKPSS
ncbi:MAG TPA: energy transducer TonB [Candidatus Udaeobacter sp.]|nr:energy transducer TonB [Candidatus Udaeobacter sp.]